MEQGILKNRLASIISIIGHPLLTLPVFTIVALFTHEEFDRALMHAIFILAGFFLPVALKMYLNSKNGTYTNFDVSNKNQRQSWYVFAILLLFAVTVIVFLTDQPRSLCIAVLLALILLVGSQLINLFIKSSLHVSANIFLGFLIIPMNGWVGLFFIAFIVPVAWSRLVLKSHILNEVVVGSLIGFGIGISSLFLL